MSMSPEKLAANQQNAKRSTGPRTLTGKRVSRQNALKQLRASRLRATLTPVARAMHAWSDEGGGLHGRPNRRRRGAAGARPVRGRGRDRGRLLRDLRYGPAQRHGGMGPPGCDPRARVLGPDRGGWARCRRGGGGGGGHRGGPPRLRGLGGLLPR